MTGDGNSYINGFYLDISVSHIKGNGCKIGVLILKARCLEPHYHRTGVGSLSLCQADKREVLCDVIQLCVSNSNIACHTMGCAVIIECAGITGDSDGDVDRSDRDRAVGYLKGDCRKVVVCILELLCGESHICCACIGSLSLCRTAECKVGFGIQR